MRTTIKKTISLLLALIMTCSVFLMTACQENNNNNGNENGGDGENNNPSAEPMVDPVDDNYRTFYQIFVGSFSDGNGDGIGDLHGIIKHLDYLNDGDINSGNDLGVQGIWLSPIFSSPSYHKYDAKDYYEIDWRFGTMETLKKLVDKCHERNVKVILDLVINHTSSQHHWFKEFINARMSGDTENKYYDYYTAVTTAEKKGGTIYQKIAGVDYWFECNFSGDMPELNYDNPEVREEMLNVAKYYLDLGVDGFRFDAVKYIYFGDAERSVDFWKWYMDELTAYAPDIYCVGECWSAESEILEYYEAMNCFNFGISGAESVVANVAKSGSIGGFLNYIIRYQKAVKGANPNGMPIQFLSNHDQDRIAGAFIVPAAMKIAASMYLLSPGSPFIYYGEEIGLRGSRGGEMTDANRRLAMRWGDGDLIKNPEGSTYPDSKQISTTVTSQLEDPTSLLNHYSKLINLRSRYAAIARGEYTAIKTSKSDVGGFLVQYEGDTIGIIHNVSSKAITVDLAKSAALSEYMFEAVLECVGEGSATLDGTTLTIDGYTSIILK